jgi:hypothetical protein
MSLVECLECGGVVSDAASTCPHCGHPSPARSTGSGAPLTPDRRSQASEVGKPEVLTPEARAFWSVGLWTVGFFILGVAVNAGIEAAGIAASGDFGWSTTYRSSWFRVLVPYVTAAIGALIGLARRRGGTRGPFGYVSLGLSLVLAMGIGMVLVGAAKETARSEIATVAAQSTTTSRQPTTTTTDLLDRWVYCSEDSQLMKDTDCDGEAVPFDRWSYCLDNFREDTDCDGVAELSWLVFDYYWIEQWLPLWEEVAAAAQEQDEPRARVLCQVASGERAVVATRIPSWEQGPLREIALAWFQEMEVALTACANGEWGVVDDSRERVHAYLAEACPLIRSAGVSSLRCDE